MRDELKHSKNADNSRFILLEARFPSAFWVMLNTGVSTVTYRIN